MDKPSHPGAPSLVIFGRHETGGLPAQSEEALARSFIDREGAGLRHVAAAGRWYVWTGTAWEADDIQAVLNRVRRHVAALAVTVVNERHAAGIASAATIAAVERLARCDERVAIRLADFDTDPFVLNTPGGIVDLRTGAVAPHDPAALCSRITAVAPAPPGTPAPTWDAFLARVTGGDAGLAGYLHRVGGYALSGDVSAQALFFVYGPGGNGKGVFTNTMLRVSGGYATTVASETFMAAGYDRHPTDIADLCGARLVVAPETEEGRRWAESRVKQLTGGDPVKARHMRQDPFEFRPQLKLLVSGNHLPSLRSPDEAMRRRLHMVPFTVVIPEAERDAGLPDRLEAEWPAILRRFIDGCLAWQRGGLAPPDVVRRATADYLDAQDVLGEWLAERTFAAPGAFVLAQVLFDDWKAWAEARGEFIGSLKVFSPRLEARGFVRARPNGGRRGFLGLALRGRSDP